MRKKYTYSKILILTIKDIRWYPTRKYKLIKLYKRAINCAAYLEASRKATTTTILKRKPLTNLIANIVKCSTEDKERKRPKYTPRTRYSCCVYRIPFCTKTKC